MRANPLVCVEWDEVASHYRWESIVAFGSYEELPGPPDVERDFERLPGRAAPHAPVVADDSEIGHERQRALELLRKHANWWEPGCATWSASDTRDHTKPLERSTIASASTGLLADEPLRPTLAQSGSLLPCRALTVFEHSGIGCHRCPARSLKSLRSG